MAGQGVASMFAVALLVGAFASLPMAVRPIGVDYGMNGNNLPSPSSVVSLYRSKGIANMRIYSPDASTLRALGGSGIGLIIDVPNSDLSSIAASSSAAASWVQSNIRAYSGLTIRYIAVGNEVPDGMTQFILPAMRNMEGALSSVGLGGIKVSTSVSFAVVGTSFPPSSGAFSGPASNYMTPIVQHLAQTGAPLLANIYPYFTYANNQGSISLQYALFTAPGTQVTDPNNGLQYQNLFDAQVDALYFAMQRAGGGNVGIVVSESGWPSAGGTGASAGNAQTYNQNLINHVGKGTPKNGAALETYIFAMFNENQKSGGVEQNFGLFFPNQQPVYPINFH